MAGEDKKPSVVVASTTVSTSGKRSVPLWLYGVGVLVLIAVVGLLTIFLPHTLQTSKSDQLTNLVKGFEDGKHTCKQGLPKISPYAQDLRDPSSYTVASREVALDYLSSCTFMAGHTTQGIGYALQLDKLYAQDGSKSAAKRHQLAQTITYMKNYGK